MGTAVNFLAGCMAGGVLAICGDGGDIGGASVHVGPVDLGVLVHRLECGGHIQSGAELLGVECEH